MDTAILSKFTLDTSALLAKNTHHPSYLHTFQLLRLRPISRPKWQRYTSQHLCTQLPFIYAQSRFGRVVAFHELMPQKAWSIAHGIVDCANSVPKDVLDKANKLLGIAIVGVGYDNIDTSLRQGQQTLSINNFGRSLRGKIVDMGTTARRAAEVSHHAFDCTIHVFSPTSAPTKWGLSDHVGPLPHNRHDCLTLMFPIIDILTLHCPLTASTKNMISKDEFWLVEQGSVLVNMSRGAVVDEVAFADELKRSEDDEGESRKVWTAASAVFVVESIRKDSVNRLLKYDNFIGLPYMSIMAPKS
ncbi:hypothetical protein L204_102097 [Cryptococcus depauperatus]